LDRPQARKGFIGEDIVRRHLEAKNVVVYGPETDAAHPFDKLCATKDKRSIFIAEAKAKPARTFYPDTGINTSHLEDYRHIRERYRMEIFVYFVDEDSETIYGNKLSVLEQPREVEHKGRQLSYPLRHNGIVYFPLEAMVTVGSLSEKDVAALRSLSQRKLEYVDAAAPSSESP